VYVGYRFADAQMLKDEPVGNAAANETEMVPEDVQ
jgi:hypothetical protein